MSGFIFWIDSGRFHLRSGKKVNAAGVKFGSQGLNGLDHGPCAVQEPAGLSPVRIRPDPPREPAKAKSVHLRRAISYIYGLLNYSEPP